MMPISSPLASVMPRQPKPFCVIKSSASRISVPSGASGSRSPECITSRDMLQVGAERAAGMELQEVVGGEAARFKERDGERVAERHLDQRRGGGRQAVRAGLLDLGQDQRHVGGLRERGIGAGGHRDERHAEARGIEDDAAQLRRLARPGERQHHVVLGDHAEVAVARLGRMHEEGRCAGRGERRGDLGADVAALAHAGDDDAARRRARSARAPPRTARACSP